MLEINRNMAESNRKIIKIVGETVESKNVPTKSTESTTIHNDKLKQGNLSLRQVVRGLSNLGMSTISIYNTLLHYNYIYKYICSSSKEDLCQSIHNLLDRKNGDTLTVYEEIKAYIEGQPL